MNYKIIFLIIMILLSAFILINKDVNRYPVSGILKVKYTDDYGIHHFIIVNDSRDIDISEIPEDAFRKYYEYEYITIMIRTNQYRYIGDIR